MVGQKLDLYENNLNKKIVLLQEMTGILDRQMQLFESPDMQPEELDLCMEKQGVLTEELEVLNEESDELYSYFQAADIGNGLSDVSKIAKIKELLSRLAGEYTQLQDKEQGVRKQMEEFFQKERKNFGAGRRSSKAALNYYRNMSGSTVVPPQFMDRKK